MIKIAVPNKGALSEGTVKLIQQAGYGIKIRTGKELRITDAQNQVDFFFIRPTDIPAYVASGIFAYGVTGRDIMADSGHDLHEALPLGFGRSKMRYIIPQGESFRGLEQFRGKRIACSYGHLLREHLKKGGVEATVVDLDGAVEISIQLGIADYAADVVETGTTIREAGLQAVGEPIIESEAILYSRDAASVQAEPLARTFIKRLNGILVARQYVMVEYDIPVQRLEEACAIARGIESPTVSTLRDKAWAAVRVMVKADESAAILDRLEEVGGRGIIVSDIRTCRL